MPPPSLARPIQHKTCKRYRMATIPSPADRAVKRAHPGQGQHRPGPGRRTTAEPTDRLPLCQPPARPNSTDAHADAPRFVITMSSLADTNAASGYPPSVLIWSDGMCSFRVTLNTHQGLVTAAGLSVTHVIVIRLRLLTRCPAPAPGRRPARAWQPPAPAARWAFPARPAPGPAHACAPPPPDGHRKTHNAVLKARTLRRLCSPRRLPSTLHRRIRLTSRIRDCGVLLIVLATHEPLGRWVLARVACPALRERRQRLVLCMLAGALAVAVDEHVQFLHTAGRHRVGRLPRGLPAPRQHQHHLGLAALQPERMPRVVEPQGLRPLPLRKLHRHLAAVVTADCDPPQAKVDMDDGPGGAVGDPLTILAPVWAGEPYAVADVDLLAPAGVAVHQLSGRPRQLPGPPASGLAQAVEGVDGGVGGVGDDLHPLQAALVAVAVPGVYDLLDRGGGVRDQVHPAAGPEVGQRLVRVALAEEPADLPVCRVALAHDGGELRVPADGLVDLGVPAGRADRLGLLGVAQGADDRRPGRLEEPVHAVGVDHAHLLHDHHHPPVRTEPALLDGLVERLDGIAVVQLELARGAPGGVGRSGDHHGGLAVALVGADDGAHGGGLAGAGPALQRRPPHRRAQVLDHRALLGGQLVAGLAGDLGGGPMDHRGRWRRHSA